VVRPATLVILDTPVSQEKLVLQEEPVLRELQATPATLDIWDLLLLLAIRVYWAKLDQEEMIIIRELDPQVRVS